MTYITGVGVGDILAVRGSGVQGEAIRLGSALIDLPNMEAHICGVHHIDKKTGVVWGIEAEPGGVGWRDCADYLNSVYTITNRNQPKTDIQRQGVASYLEEMLKTKYDWIAIAEDGLRDLHLEAKWEESWAPPQGGTALSPAHVVCSSLLVYAYKSVELAYPDKDQSGAPLDPRNVQPADWTEFFLFGHYT